MRNLRLDGAAKPRWWKVFHATPPPTAPLRSLIVEPDDGLLPVLDFIQSATTSLRVKMFTLDHEAIINALVEAKARGVAVRVMLNPQKADDSRTNDGSMQTLLQQDVPVQWTNPAFPISHEKSMVADDQRALLGTFNFGVKYFTRTRDLGVITEDRGQVAEIAACFDADWERAPFQCCGTNGLVWSVGNARRAMVEVIDSARRRLDIAHTKFVDAIVVERLLRACARKVKVRIMIGNVLQLQDAAESVAALRMLRRQGARIRHLRRPKMHAKLILADQSIALLGSQNILRGAFDLRRELGILLQDGALVGRLHTIFSNDWKQARRVKMPDPMLVLEPPLQTIHS